MKKLYLVDASNMFFRAFFALPPMTSPAGMPTNALYGFLSMTLKLIREVRPDYLVYCFDRKEPSFRNELYSDYKANRDEMPDDLQPQIPYLKKLTEVLGVRCLEKEKFEADDIIGTLAEKGAREGMDVVIVSGDKDFAQLVKPGIRIHDTMKDRQMDVEGVQEKFGVRPDQIIDYLALCGDSSDNIPGVRGIGPKGAQKLLNEYRTLEEIYEHVDEIKGSTQKKLIESREMAFLSKKLVSIVTDVKVDFEWPDLTLKEINRDELQALLQELGFRSFEKSIFSPGGDGTPAPAVKSTKPSRSKTQSSTSWEELEWNEDQLTRIQPYSEVWGIWNERGLAVGFDGKVLRLGADEKSVGLVLKGKNLKFKGYDLKEFFKALGLRFATASWDSQLAAYVAEPSPIDRIEKYYPRLTGATWPELPTFVDYVKANIELEGLLREILKERSSLDVYENLDLPLISVLADIEQTGVAVDVDELKRQSEELTKELAKTQKTIYKLAGTDFNIASPKQLAHILFDKLGLPKGRKTKTGYSTDSDVLEGLRAAHPIAEHVLEFREMAKLKNTYLDALPQLIQPKTGRIHTQLNQTATSTGRLSSTNPNLQNIPIRTERGRRIRKAFIAENGKVLISADYSQIELRILAHIANDPGLTEAFRQDLDIHSATAAEVFGVPIAEVTSEQRRIAKAVNFGIAYGQGAFGLAETLGISRGESSEIIKKYFERYSGVREYMQETVRIGREHGYVETLFGRRRYIEELQSKNQNLQRAGERAAINAPIQGTASDLVKLAMIRLHSSLQVPMLLQVHDELLFECPEEDVNESCDEIKSIMESVHKLNVPLKVNVGVGKNWFDAH